MNHDLHELQGWVVCAFLLGLSVLAAAYNIHALYVRPRRLGQGERAPSPLPIVGGALGAFGCLQAPSVWAKLLFWLPILLDPGCGFYLYQGVKSYRKSQREQDARNGALSESRAAIGCLLGTAVGDALGLAAEGLSRRRQQAMYPDLDSYHFLLGRGFCSDDTEHACMTANALISASYYPDDFVDTFKHSLAWRFRFWLLGVPAGVGLATGRGIIRLWCGFSPDTSGVFSAGNGPAMRAPILGVCYGSDRALLRKLVRASARLTHSDPRAEQSAYAVALAAHFAASGAPCDASVFQREMDSAYGAEGAETLAAVIAAFVSAERGESTADFAVSIGCGAGVSGYALHTAPVCLHAWYSHQGDFRAAVRAVIHRGGDADTTGAIVGALAGASAGKDGIPLDWLEGLVEWPRTPAWIERLGAAVAASARPAPEGAIRYLTMHPSLFVPGLAPRNLLFLIVVLLHGLRRLLPPY